MATKAVRPKREDDHPSEGWKGLTERAPSLLRQDQPTVARFVALVGLGLATLGTFALFFRLIDRPYLINVGWGMFLLALGVSGLLYHAFNEKDLQYRRLYGALGVLLLGVAILTRILPYEREIGGLFLPVGTPALVMALVFLLAFVRNETDPAYRRLTISGLGVVGLVCALVGFIGGVWNEDFMLGQGVVMLVVGLLYLAGHVSMQDAESQYQYRAGFAIGVLGAAMILYALGRSLIPLVLYHWLGWTEARPVDTFFMPRGLLLIYLGLEYLLLSVGVCSENKLVVLTRRELAALFYSPIAYVVLVTLTLVGAFVFSDFVNRLTDIRRLPVEPIVRSYIWGFFPILAVIFIVPLLTMRLLSEERRSGTLEMLLTAPVNETPVVLSKFFAVLRVFLLAWYPWGLYLVALRVEGGQPFDYRPLLTAFITLAVMASGWLAMGLFFSSLTRNQIGAAVLTLAGMIALTGVAFIVDHIEPANPWHTVLTYISYIHLWLQSAGGTLAPRNLVFHLTFAIFWLFLTVKVLEARKWQ
jgi:ABC-type transport system involved in multi-copper enzyme maturation permease subunit